MKTKNELTKQILGLVLALVLVLGMLPTQAYAVSDDGWYISDSILFVTDKLTSLPQYSYNSINVTSNGELAFAESEVWKYEVINSGTISGGTFQGEVENYGTISGGAFQEKVLNHNTISGGMFHGKVENTLGGDISGGTFLNAVEAVENYGTISGGTFLAEVKNKFDGFISGGTFRGFVTNDYRITDGTFSGFVTNNGYIGGGTYENTVGNSDGGTIEGGIFSFHISNNGVIIKAKILGASFNGNDPQSVIHNVSGEDKPLAYGKDLLGELGEVQEGTAWYADDTCVSGGTVPMNYTEYTLKAHSHNYAYTERDNKLIETCTNSCGHNETATLNADAEYTYNGSAITPATITYSDGWQGEKVDNSAIAYVKNLNAGTATASVELEGKTITTIFAIKAADIAGAAITLNPTSGTYDGSEQKPTVSVTWNGNPLAVNTDYILSWDKSNFETQIPTPLL